MYFIYIYRLNDRRLVRMELRPFPTETVRNVETSPFSKPFGSWKQQWVHSDSDNYAPRFAQRNSKRHIFEATKNWQPQELCPKNSFHKNFHRCHVSQEPLIQRVAQCIMCPHFQVRSPILLNISEGRLEVVLKIPFLCRCLKDLWFI